MSDSNKDLGLISQIHYQVNSVLPEEVVRANLAASKLSDRVLPAALSATSGIEAALANPNDSELNKLAHGMNHAITSKLPEGLAKFQVDACDSLIGKMSLRSSCAGAIQAAEERGIK